MASAAPIPFEADLSLAPMRRLWKILREARKPLSQADLFCAADIEPELYFSLVDNWSRRNLLLTQVNPLRFIMTDAARAHAVPPPGTPSKTKSSVPKRSGRQRLWAAMRVLKEFDLRTLCLAADAGEKGAIEFLNCLVRTGYLVTVRAERGEPILYRLARNTGPKHPIIRRRWRDGVSVVEADDRNDGELRVDEVDMSARRSGSVGKRPSDDGGVS